MVDVWEWGHRKDCSCSICSTLRRVCFKIERFSGVPAFRDYVVQRSRNFLGELDDWLDFHLAPPNAAREGAHQGEGTAPPSPGQEAAGPEKSGAGEELATAAGKGKSTESRQDSASTPSGLLGLRAVPKAGSTTSSARGNSRPIGEEAPEEDSEAKKEGGKDIEQRESREATPRTERKKEKRRKEKKKSKSRSRKKEERRGRSKRKRSRSRSGLRIRERTRQRKSPHSSKGDDNDFVEVKLEPEEEGPRRETGRERTEERRREKPPEPDRSPVFRYRREVEGLGRDWQGPIPAVSDSKGHRGANKGSKKRETQKNFSKYKQEHGHGLGFYRPWK